MSYGNSGDFGQGNPPAGQNPSGQYPGGPFSAGPQPVPPKKSSALWWVLGIIGFLTVGGALLCCGTGYYAFRFTTQMMGEMVKGSIASDPAVQEHIGTISELSMNLTATGEAGGGGASKKIVFDIRGDKGSGQIEVIMANGPNPEAIESCVLILPNGERHEVKVDTSKIEGFQVTPGEPVPTEADPVEPTMQEPETSDGATKLESELLNPEVAEPIKN